MFLKLFNTHNSFRFNTEDQQRKKWRMNISKITVYKIKVNNNNAIKNIMVQ